MEIFDTAGPVPRGSILICFSDPGRTQVLVSAVIPMSQVINLTLTTWVHTARGAVSEASASALENWGVTALKDTPWLMWAVKTLEDHFCRREPRTTDCTHLQGLSTFSDLNNTCLGLMFLLSPVPLSFALCRHYLQFLTQVILLGTPKPAAWLIHLSPCI